MPLEIQPCAILKMKTGFLSGLNSLIRAAQYILHLDMPAKSLIVSPQAGWVVPEGLDTQKEDFHGNLGATQNKPGRG